MRVPELRREIAATAHLAGPLIGGQVAYIGLNVLDTVMAGAIDAVALGAVAVGSSTLVLGNIAVFGTMHGLTPAVAHLWGEGRVDRIGATLRQALWLAGVLALLFVLYLAFAGPRLLAAFGVDADLLPVSGGYLRALAWGAPAVVLFYALRFTCEGVGVVRPTLLISLAALPVNGFLNWVLMFGKLGLPRLGAVGTGYATAIVWWLQGLAFLVFVLRSAHFREARLFERFEWPRLRPIAEFLRLGAPIGAAWFMEVSLFAVSGILIGSLGKHIVSGHQIALNVASLTFMVPFGFAMATTVRVGHALGAGDAPGASRAAWSGILAALAIQAVNGSLMLLLPRWIAALYTSDREVQDVAVSLLLLAAVFQLSDGVQAAAAGALRGYKDTRMVMAITSVAYWVIGLPLAYFLGFRQQLGARGMWIGFIAGLTVAAIGLVLRLRGLTKRTARTAKNASGLES